MASSSASKGTVVASLAYQRPGGVALVPLAPVAPTLGVMWRSGDLAPAAKAFLRTADEVSRAEGWPDRALDRPG